MEPDAGAIAHLIKRSSLGAPENAVGFVMWRVVHSYLREVDRALDAMDLTHLQFMILMMTAWLAREGGPVLQADVARHGSVQPMQVSLVLKTLEAKGLVGRPRDPADVRAKRVVLNAAGLAALEGALPVIIAVQRRFFGEEGDVGGPLLGSLLALDAGSAGDPRPARRQRRSDAPRRSRRS